MSELQHKHLIIRAEINNPPKDVNETAEWYKKFVSDMGMKILQGPFVDYHEEVGNRGMTGAVTITTSHSAFHIWDETTPAILQFDLYTCGEMDFSKVMSNLSFFDPVSIRYKYLDREKDLQVLENGYLIPK